MSYRDSHGAALERADQLQREVDHLRQRLKKRSWWYRLKQWWKQRKEEPPAQECDGINGECPPGHFYPSNPPRTLASGTLSSEPSTEFPSPMPEPSPFAFKEVSIPRAVRSSAARYIARNHERWQEAKERRNRQYKPPSVEQKTRTQAQQLFSRSGAVGEFTFRVTEHFHGPPEVVKAAEVQAIEDWYKSLSEPVLASIEEVSKGLRLKPITGNIEFYSANKPPQNGDGDQ